MIEYGTQALEAYACPECLAVKKFVEVLCHLFDPGMGLYDHRVGKYPAVNKPATAIHFNNTCTGDYDGYPNEYLIAFQLYGPQKYVSDLEYDQESINKFLEQSFGPQK